MTEQRLKCPSPAHSSFLGNTVLEFKNRFEMRFGIRFLPRARFLTAKKMQKKCDEKTRPKKCPKCDWHPGEANRWLCHCGNSWNTFDTNGNCPACGRPWSETQCLSCLKWSTHCDWYHEFNDDESEKEEVVIEKTNH